MSNGYKPGYVAAVMLSQLLLMACLSDRLPPEPVEIDRPILVAFAAADTSAFAVDVRHPITMHFNEFMDEETFTDNFTLSDTNGTIEGIFTAEDTTVIFTPSEDMQLASVYTAAVTGGIRDIHGNSMSIDSTEEAFRHSMWFFTAGDYSDGGYYPVYLSDRSADSVIHMMGNFNEHLETLDDLAEKSEEIAVTPDGSLLLIISSLSNGVISVLDLATNQLLEDSLAIGIFPTDLVTTNTTAYVVNRTGQTLSIVDLVTLTETDTLAFPDGFRPRHIAISPDASTLYLTSHLTAEKGTVKVIDVATLSETATIEDVLLDNKSVALAVSADGAYLYLAQFRSDQIAVLDLATNTILTPLILPVRQNSDLVASGDHIFAATSGGFIYKIVAATQTIVDSAAVSTGLIAMEVTPGGELLYSTSPNDATVVIVETATMELIRQPKVLGVPKRIAIGSAKF